MLKYHCMIVWKINILRLRIGTMSITDLTSLRASEILSSLKSIKPGTILCLVVHWFYEVTRWLLVDKLNLPA